MDGPTLVHTGSNNLTTWVNKRGRYAIAQLLKVLVKGLELGPRELTWWKERAVQRREFVEFLALQT